MFPLQEQMLFFFPVTLNEDKYTTWECGVLMCTYIKTRHENKLCYGSAWVLFACVTGSYQARVTFLSFHLLSSLPSSSLLYRIVWLTFQCITSLAPFPVPFPFPSLVCG